MSLLWGYIWAQVNPTEVSTILGHQMSILGGTPNWRSAWPKGWPNVNLTLCSISWSLDASTGGTSELRSTRPKLVPFLATRCLYWGYIWLKVSLTQSWPYAVPLLANRCLLHGGISELRSTKPKLVPFLATRCFYQGLHLTEGQPDPKADQMSSWPHKADQMSTWPNVVPLLVTRCLYMGVHLGSGQPDLS